MARKTTRRQLTKQAMAASIGMGAIGQSVTQASMSSEAHPNEDKVRWEEMLPDELLSAIRDCPVCYCGFGLAEPHGPYSALGVDWIKAHGIAERAAKAHGGIVAPPFAWHLHDRPSFPWLERQGITQTLCSAIPADLWLRVVLHQIRALDARGFHVGILISGHYGGLENDLRLLCDYYMRRTRSPIKLFAAADHELIRLEGCTGDHAGITETSQMLAIRPDLIDLSRKVEGWPTGRWAGCSFPLDDGRMPSAQLGEQIVGSQVARLGEVQKELLANYRPQQDWQPPSQTDVDALWQRFESLTRKYWWCSLTLDEMTTVGMPQFPGWEALGE